MASLEKQFDKHLWALKLLATILLTPYTRLRDRHPNDTPGQFQGVFLAHAEMYEACNAHPTFRQFVAHHAAGFTVTNPVDGAIRLVPDRLVCAYLEQEYQQDRPGRLGIREEQQRAG